MPDRHRDFEDDEREGELAPELKCRVHVHHHFHHCRAMMPMPFPDGIEALQIPPTTCPDGTLHVVAPGETLWSLAARFGLQLSTVIAANPQLTDPNVLVPGQTICLPGTAGPGTPPIPPPCPGGRLYVVAPGDTLTAIARRFGLTVAAILAANPRISSPDLIFAGQTICIPVPPDGQPPGPPPPPPAVCAGRLYEVQRGDTVSAIARRFGTTVNAIVAANPQIVNPNIIAVGQVICVPSAVGTSG